MFSLVQLKLLLLLVIALAELGSSFQPSVLQKRILHYRSRGFISGSSNNNKNLIVLLSSSISSVTVCTGELCRCQEDDDLPLLLMEEEEQEQDGGAAEIILKTLQSQNLPYPIEEEGCLGSCGVGAVVCIEYDDGSSSLVTGWKETANELGLLVNDGDDDDVSSTVTTSVILEEGKKEEEIDEYSATEVKADETNNDNIIENNHSSESKKATVSTSSSPGNKAQSSSPPLPVKQSKTVINVTNNNRKQRINKKVIDINAGDARERMRAASKEDQSDDNANNNPWGNAAMYLANKAKEKFFG